MSRIKGKYVATITIEFDVERVPGMNSIEEIEINMSNDSLAQDLKQFLEDGLGEGFTVTVEGKYAHLSEVDDDGVA